MVPAQSGVMWEVPSQRECSQTALFILFISDLPDTTENVTTYMFAYDTNIYNGIYNSIDCAALQGDVRTLAEWSESWLLKFHCEKCKVLLVGR